MNWNPLKKFGKHNVKGPPASCPSNSENKGDVEKYLSKVEQLEGITKKLSKDVKKHSDYVLAVNRCETKMTADLSNSVICQDDEKLRQIVEEWHSFTSEMKDASEEQVVVTHKTMVEPLKRFQGVFSEIRTASKKRDQAQQELVKCQQKVQRLQERERTGQNLVRLEMAKQALANSTEEMKSQEQMLINEIPQVLEGRIDYFQPCLEALIRSQTQYWGNSVGIFGGALGQSLGSSTHSEYAYAESQQKRLTDIHALSIVADA